MSRMSVAEVRAVAQQRRAAIVDIPVEQPKPASRLRSRFLPGSAPAEARPGASAPPRAEGDIAALESVLKACAAFRRKIGLIHGAIGAVLGTVIGFAIGLDAILALGFAVLGFLIGYALAGQLSKRPAPARKPQKLANRRGARLFALIEQTARRLEMQAPKTILLTDGAYIWLPPTQKPGRAALEIGLPLLESLSVPALSALIARAFHRSREVARSPFRHVFTEIAAIESMAAKLSARSPALALGMAPKAAELADSLRRAATPILRGIDRGADSIAISAVGTGELADAIVAQTVLRHQFSAQDGLDLEEQLIAIRSGIADEDVDAAIRMALTRPETDAGYSHQPLRERLQRL
ncbi:MAG: hypothetical protein KDI98_01830, partial [Hyphomicrobiaceae bacterium]|nr:hypothetical protein [Hyphomicrobiaceae bacterium]